MTPGKGTSRRDYLKLMAAGAGLAATAPASWAQEAVKKTMTADPRRLRPIMTDGFNGGRKPSSECSFIGGFTA